MQTVQLKNSDEKIVLRDFLSLDFVIGLLLSIIVADSVWSRNSKVGLMTIFF